MPTQQATATKITILSRERKLLLQENRKLRKKIVILETENSKLSKNLHLLSKL